MRSSANRTSSTRRQTNRHRLEFDTLELRDVPSVSSTAFNVNTTRSNNQYESATSSAKNGLKIVVWTHRVNDANTDIRGQLFESNGIKRGGELRITSTSRNESSPAVAMADNGTFKVAWQDQVSSSSNNIMVASFNSVGQRLISNFDAGTARNEVDPSIAVDVAGNFVVTFTQSVPRANEAIVARMFTHAGGFQREVIVSNTTIDRETNSSVARSRAPIGSTNSGIFDVTYEFNGNIAVKRFSATGNFLRGHVVASGSSTQLNPKISMDDLGRSVICYQEGTNGTYDIAAKTLSNLGTLSARIEISPTVVNERTPAVAVDRTNGNFVIAFQYGSRLAVQEMRFNGQRITRPQFLGNVYAVSKPAIAMDGAKNYLITYTVGDTSADPGLGIHGRRGTLVTPPPPQ